MKRAFLTDLGLEQETVDKIIKEHGKTVNSLKDDLDKVDDYKQQVEDLQGQIKERDKQLETLKGSAKGNEDLEKKIKDLEDQNKQTAKEYQEKLDKQEFDFKLEKALTDARAKNPKAVKALLNEDDLKLQDGEIKGLSDQLEKLQESDDYLFQSEGLKGRQPHIPNGKQEPSKNPFTKEHLNLTEQAKLMKEDPELAKQLKAQAGVK
ncbi:phage scaffolding protein [Virgibacillus salexigens]|uniref:phage scaffolding protein n=1 Tax=Virgibacillus salexigens TaxID=61016 RepID=UPI00190B6AB2|nr:phage scaffolding protein [Virgibacillus salexigens]